ASEQVAAVLISNGQWITIFAIPHPELPLEVSTPESIRTAHLAQISSCCLGYSAPPSAQNKIMLLEKNVNGATSGYLQTGVLFFQMGHDLWCPPREMLRLEI